MPPAAILGLGALAGGVAGALGEEKTTEKITRLELAPETELEREAGEVQLGQFREISGLVAGGPGAGDLQAALQAQRGLAGRLGGLAEIGALPTREDISRTAAISRQLFAPEQTALQQAFQQQQTESERLSARLGRPVTDPVLQAKLRTGFLRQQAQLEARIGARGQELALQQPFQRLEFAQQRAQILGGLGTQALANRSALLGLGRQLAAGERQFRVQTATQLGEITQRTGGGFAGALTGAVAGLGAGGQLAGGFGQIFGGAQGAGGGGATTATPRSPFVF